MSWFDKLAGLIKVNVRIDLRKLINIQVKKNVIQYHVTVSPDNPPVHFDPRTNIIQVNPQKLTKKEQKRFRSSLREATAEDYTLIEKESRTIIEDLRAQEDLNRELLQLLRPHIPPEDYRALIASLYLRSRYQAGENVQSLKEAISRDFGKRGRTIANLCSAGYFENFVVPVLRKMKEDPKFNAESFSKFYRTIIKEQAFAVFVHGGMAASKISQAIRDKITTNRRYGLAFVSIHGIGKSNIQKIQQTVDQAIKEFPWLLKTNERIIGEAVFIRLEFRAAPDSKA